MLPQEMRMRFALTLIIVIATFLSACNASTLPDVPVIPKNPPTQQTPINTAIPMTGVPYPIIELDNQIAPYPGPDGGVPPAPSSYPIQSSEPQPTPYPPVEAAEPAATLLVETATPVHSPTEEKPLEIAFPVTILPTVTEEVKNGATQPALDNDFVPVAIVSFENKILRFDCVNGAVCPNEVDLKDEMADKSSVDMWRALYWGPDSIFVIFEAYVITADPQLFILHINQQTGQNKITRLQKDKAYDMAVLIDGQLALLDATKPEILIFDQDLNAERVHIELSNAQHTLHMLGASRRQLAVWNELPVLIDNQYFFEYSIIDMQTKQVVDRKVKFQEAGNPTSDPGSQPEQKYLGYIKGISSDLQSIYCTYWSSNNPEKIQSGAIRLDRIGEELAVKEARINLMGADKYRDMLFQLGEDTTSYGHSAVLVNMATGKSLLDDLPQINRFGRVLIRGFGDSMLLGTPDAIYQVTFDGKLIQQYELPPQWVNEDYLLMEYVDPY